MRQWVFGKQGRRISWSLIVAFLLPLLVFGPGQQRSARAQITKLPAVAALEFGVLPSVKTSGILGRQATDAVVIEMTRTGRFDVTPRQQLNQQLIDSDLTLPLNNNGIQKLGQSLGVDRVLSGDVTEVLVSGNPKRAKVTLSVRLTDVVTGELANGAISSGYSPPPPPGADVDDETLVNQALSDAAFNAIRSINNYTLPTATVLLSGNEVRLNRGQRDGLTVNQEMIVVRGPERVGKIRVTSVAATDSVAAIIDPGKGIRPEDQAVAIFRLPGYNVDPSGTIRNAPVASVDTYSPARKSKKNLLGVILAVAATIVVASFLLSTKNSSSGRTVSGVTARAYAESSVIASADTTAGRVELTWQDRSGVPTLNIVEYHIYRNNQIIGISHSRIFVDDITVPTLFSYTQIAFAGGGGTNSVGQNSSTTTGTTTGTTNGGTTGGGGTNTNGGLETPSSTTTIQTIAPAIPVGTPIIYKVTTLYRQITAVPGSTGSGTTSGGGTGGNGGGTGGNGGGTGGNGGGTGGNGGGGNGGGNSGGGGNGGGTTNGIEILYRESPVDDSGASGQATPIARPSVEIPPRDPNSTDNSQPLSGVQAKITPVQGADQYVIEFATTPTFSKKFVYGPFFTQFSGGSPKTFQFPVGLSNVARGATVFVRVGARSSTDNPGPKPFGVPNAGSYVYNSEPVTFLVVDTPPGVPGGV